MNMFEIAARKQFRFPSVRGDLTVEQLFSLPLTSTVGTKANLNSIAIAVNNELKAAGEESFVETASSNPARADLATKLDILKFVIADRQAENARITQRAERSALRTKIHDALAAKRDQALSQASEDDLLRQLAALDEA